MKKLIKFITVTLCLFLLCSFVSCSSGSSSSNDEKPSSEKDPWYDGEGFKDEEIDDEISREDALYLASKSSNKYHRLSCRYADQIKPENIVYYEYEYQATDDGKEPCAVCKP